MVSKKLEHLPSMYQTEKTSMLRGIDIVAWSLGELRPATVPVKHRFELTDETPIYSRNRRLPPEHNELVRNEIDRMVASGIISLSHPARSFPVVIARKMDGKARFLSTTGN